VLLFLLAGCSHPRVAEDATRALALATEMYQAGCIEAAPVPAKCADWFSRLAVLAPQLAADIQAESNGMQVWAVLHPILQQLVQIGIQLGTRAVSGWLGGAV
jgi:hypothetical protein